MTWVVGIDQLYQEFYCSYRFNYFEVIRKQLQHIDRDNNIVKENKPNQNKLHGYMLYGGTTVVILV